jgi:hypothetical protein
VVFSNFPPPTAHFSLLKLPPHSRAPNSKSPKLRFNMSGPPELQAQKFTGILNLAVCKQHAISQWAVGQSMPSLPRSPSFVPDLPLTRTIALRSLAAGKCARLLAPMIIYGRNPRKKAQRVSHP